MGVGIETPIMRNLINRVKARKMAKRYRTPNCTHLTMDRVFGRHQQCDVCGRSPSIGFLYECRQDWETQSLHDILMEDVDGDAAKSNVRLHLSSLGFNESIIRAAEDGHYTNMQLDTIVAQKTELRQIISDSLQASQINSAAAKLAAIAHTPSNNDGVSDSMLGREAGPPPCAMKACHSCRPYYRDRVWISFQAVIDADFPPMTLEDLDLLPTKSAQIMQTISTSSDVKRLHSSSPLSLPTFTSLATSTDVPPTASTATSTSSDLTFKTTQTDIDVMYAQGRPRRGFYKQDHRSSGDITRALSRRGSLIRPGLRLALQGLFRPSRASSSSGSSITLPDVPRTGKTRTSSETEDLEDLPALRKMRRKRDEAMAGEGVKSGGTNQGSTAVDSGVECQDDGSHDTSSSSFDYSLYSDASDGSDIEVESSAAPTGDVVETPTVSISRVDVSLKSAVVVQDEEMDEDADDEADIGLESIMAQV